MVTSSPVRHVALLALLLLAACEPRIFYRTDKYGYWPPNDWLPSYCPDWQGLGEMYDGIEESRPLKEYELKRRRQVKAQYEERCK